MDTFKEETFVNDTARKWAVAYDLSPFSPRDDLVDDMEIISKNQEYLIMFLKWFINNKYLNKYRGGLISGPIEDFINTVDFDEEALAKELATFPEICKMFIEAWADEWVEIRLKSALGKYCQSASSEHFQR